MRISGSFDTPRRPERVYAQLTDPAWLVQALDYPAPTSASADECIVRGDVGFGPMHGTIEIHLRIAERDENKRAVYTGWGNGLGSSLTLHAGFDLGQPAEGCTRVDWYGEATIDGPVAPIASGMFHPLSQRNFDHLKRSLETDLDE